LFGDMVEVVPFRAPLPHLAGSSSSGTAAAAAAPAVAAVKDVGVC
jgi:hypothetical protein